MNIEFIRKYCLSLPHTEEDVKWGADLCFMIAKRMYCVTGLEGPYGVSFKCSDEDFQKLTEKEGIIPAPYMAKNKWVRIEDAKALTKDEWKHYIKQSYDMIMSKLPKKTQKELGAE